MAPKKSSSTKLPKSPSKDMGANETSEYTPPDGFFQVNDILYAADSGKLYEAKVLKCQQLQGDSMKYFIHYQGWQRKYDTWIDEALVAPLDDKKRVAKLKERALEIFNPSAKREAKANKNKKTKVYVGGNKAIDVETSESAPMKSPEKKKSSSNVDEKVTSLGDLAVEEVETATRKGRKRSLPQSEVDDNQSVFSDGANTAVASTNGSTTAGATGLSMDDARKRRRALLLNDLMDEEDSVISSRIHIPFQLKRHLTDEWSLVANATNVSRRCLLLPKPANKCARQVVQDFIQVKQKHFHDLCQKEELTTEEIAQEREELEEHELFFASFLNQFEMALPNILLYRYEREQFDRLVQNHADIRLQPSIAYGAEHLLRFFVRLPKLLMTAVLPPEIMDRYLHKLSEFLKFLTKQYDQYFAMSQYLPIDEALAYIPTSEGMQALQAGQKVILQFIKQELEDNIVDGKRKRKQSSKLVDSA